MHSAFDGLPHRPVLYQEIIHALQPIQGGRYVDCTLGAGGHAWGILETSTPDGILLGFDVDPYALELARRRLRSFGDRAFLVRASYVLLGEQLSKLGWLSVNGILLDLGLSSMQLDTPERGFSFLSDAPLDMRFNPDSSMSAYELVNTLAEADLAELLFRYGEEPQARQIARAIVQLRPIKTTGELAKVVSGIHSKRSPKPGSQWSARQSIHPATRTFQAIRIAVNDELKSLEVVLPQAIDALAPEGRFAVISFHSLEDRIVKQYFRQESKDCICPPRQPICTCGHKARIVELNKQPLRPQADEVAMNPRARSARLRVVEKI